MTNDNQPRFHASLASVTLKTAIVHTASYFLFGVMAVFTFNYAETFSTGVYADLMRPTSDPIVMLGTAFQPIRGALFGVVFYLLGDILFTRKHGWLIGWLMLVFIGILSPFGPTPGSIEGAIYTKFPFSTIYNISMIEVYGQSMVLSAGVVFWVRNPDNRWMRWGFSGVAVLAVLLSISSVFLAPLAN